MDIYTLKDIRNPAFRKRIKLDEQAYNSLIMRRYHLIFLAYIFIILGILISFVRGGIQHMSLFLELLLPIGLVWFLISSVYLMFPLLLKYKMVFVFVGYYRFIKLKTHWAVRFWLFAYFVGDIIALSLLFKIIKPIFKAYTNL